MKKLRLDLTDVNVISFEVPAETPNVGTVRANEDTEGVSYCGPSCAWTCGGGGPSKCDPFTDTSVAC